MPLRWLVVSLVLGLTCAVAAAEEPVLERIALGSCIQQAKPQPIWEAVVAYQPQLFLLLGDNIYIYGDSHDMKVLAAKYQQLAANAGYQKLCAACPVLAIWDDHDYGENDGGAEYPEKAESQKVFNDFFRVPADSPRRQREGLYDAQVFGPPGKRVQVIFLDTRYFRGPLKISTAKRAPGVGPYLPNRDPQATMLGAAQWQWLAEQLRVPAEVRIIASSIQFVSDDHAWEKWGNLPLERERLLKLLADTRADGVVLVSGDRHLSEISRLAPADSGLSYPLYDLTASSLNQPGGDFNRDEVNRHRLGENYRHENFGTITIDWNAAEPTLTLAVHDLQGKVVRDVVVKLSELQGKNYD